MSSEGYVKFGDYALELTPEIANLRDYCIERYSNAESVIHRFGHMERVALGAAWFVEAFGGDEREQQLAYTAGLLHDIVRPITEERCHAEASAVEVYRILMDYVEYERFRLEDMHDCNRVDGGFSHKEIWSICDAVRDHRRPPEKWKSRLHMSVYLADKLFEHMGAYLDFRACVWAGELSRTDYAGYERKPIEYVMEYYDSASKKFIDGSFPEAPGIFGVQVGWNNRFYGALQKNDDWAVDMATRLFNWGKEYGGSNYNEDFEVMLDDFKTSFLEQELWLEEAKFYMSGEKLPEFKEKLLGKNNN